MKIRILIVDDDEDLLFIAHKFLTAIDPDFKLIQVSNAQDALQHLDEDEFDGIICDFYLGKDQMNGLEILAWVREKGITAPFIIFTGHSREETAIQALNLGADYYLEKSDDLEGLFTEIAQHIKNIVRSKRMEEALLESELTLHKLSRAIECSPTAVVITDTDGIIEYVNPKFTEMTGYQFEDILGENPSILQSGLTPKETYADLWSAIAKGEMWHGEFVNKKKNGDIYWEEAWVSPIISPSGVITHFVGVKQDITKRRNIEEALRKAENRYRSLFEDSSISLWEEDYSLVKNFFDELAAEGIRDFRTYFESHPEDVERCVGLVRVLDVNKASMELHGVQDKDELLGILTKSFERDGLGIFCEELISLAEGHTYFRSDYVQLTLHGKEYVFVFQLSIPPGFEDTLSKVYLSIIDVTERARAENALKKNERILLMAQHVAQMGYLQLHLGTNEVYWSDQVYRIYGVNPEEQSATPELSLSLVHPDDLDYVQESLDRAIHEEVPYDIDHRIVREDGSVVWVHAQAELARDAEGTPSILLGTIIDITERKLIENELRYQVEILRTVSDAIVSTDEIGIIRGWNNAAETLFGWTAGEAIGRRLSEILPIVFENIENEVLFALVRNVSQWSGGASIIAKDGSKVFVFTSITSLKDKDGNVVGAVAISRDITERKKELDFLRTIIDSLTHPFHVINIADYTISLANKASSLVSLDDGITCYELTHHRTKPCDGVEHPCPIEEVKRTKAPVIVEHMHYDSVGQPRDIEIHGYPVLDADGEVVQLIEYGLDITEEKQALKALLKSEEKFRELYINAPLGYQTLDRDGSITNVNDAWLESLGYSRDDVVGQYFGDFLTPESRDRFIVNFEKLRSGTITTNIEFVMIRDDGSKMIVSIYGTAVFEDDGQFKQTHYILQDITEWKAANDILRRQKEELSELAHMMSHDLGNKMKVIVGLVTLLRKGFDEEILERITTTASQASDLLQSSAALADAGQILDEMEPVNLNDVVASIVKITIPDGIRCIIDPLPDVLGDPERINQIIQNLIINALEHGNPSEIEIRVQQFRGAIRILIRNDGTPIPLDIRDKIFLREFTTKGIGRGLGLAIVKKLIEAHGWKIELTSDQLTTFCITIPRALVRGGK